MGSPTEANRGDGRCPRGRRIAGKQSVQGYKLAGGQGKSGRRHCGQAARQGMGKSEEGHDVSGGHGPVVLSRRGRLSIDRLPQTGQMRRSIPVSAKTRSRHDGGVSGGGALGTSS